MDDDVIQVYVTRVTYTGGTVAYAEGVTVDGHPVDFAAEPRALFAIAEALDYGEGPVLADVPTWAILASCPLPRPIH